MKTIETVLRVLGTVVAVGAAGIFILPMTVRVINIGNIAGLVLSVWLFCVSVKPVGQFLSLMKNHGFTRFLYYSVNIFCAVFLVYGIVISGIMLFTAYSKPAMNATAVTLGAQVKPTGEPSRILRGRIDAAEKYLSESPRAAAVLSGGQGPDEGTSEALCMFDCMTRDGIDPYRLYMEDKSTTTRENFEYSLKLIEDEKLSPNIVIITDGFHQLRARIIADQLGCKGKIGAVRADTQWEFIPTYVVREWFAIPYQLAVGFFQNR